MKYFNTILKDFRSTEKIKMFLRWSSKAYLQLVDGRTEQVMKRAHFDKCMTHLMYCECISQLTLASNISGIK